jgi:dihydroorotase
MNKLLIANGRVIDPSQNMDRMTNLLVVDGKIAAYDFTAPADGSTEVIDAKGWIVSPGLIDIHVHLREPGFEDAETIATGTAAAVNGGFTSVACMPNTDPPIDTQGTVELIRQNAAQKGHCNVFVVACVSQNREGKQLAEIGQLVEAGAVGFSDDGAPVYDAELMRRAFEYCLMFDKPVMNHCEVRELSQKGVMHEGLVSLTLGLQGIPAAAEDVMISRDVSLAEATGGRLHIMHLSTAGGVEILRRAKARDLRITSEVTPHHFTLTDECMRSFDSNYKMHPPLRAKEDVETIIAGIKDGTIDCIACDHAPHPKEKKMQELDQAPFGITGLETSLGLVATQLVKPGHIDWPTAIAKMTINPARVVNLKKGTLAIGADADITVIDPEVRWKVDPSTLRSKSSNTPFAGWELQGRAEVVVVGGKVKLNRI